MVAITLDQLLQRAAQEIATQAAVTPADLASEISTWKEKIGMITKIIVIFLFFKMRTLGKWVRTVEAFYCLTKSPEWAEVKIDPFEKMVIRRLLWSQISGNEVAKDYSSGTDSLYYILRLIMFLKLKVRLAKKMIPPVTSSTAEVIAVVYPTLETEIEGTVSPSVPKRRDYYMCQSTLC